jgi:ribosomal-protein-alanine N-acetyltransferase
MHFSRPLRARPATPDDRSAIQTLSRYETRVHAHLDWKPVEDWLGRQPFVVAERGARLVGALACPPDLPDTAWVRLFVTAEGLESAQAWELLWPLARASLRAQRLQQVAALSLEPWSEPLYRAAGFQHTHSVVVLARSPGPPPPAAVPAGVRLRQAQPIDQAALAATDTAAFAAPWQLSAEMVHLALAQADYVSVAEYAGQVIGYQLTTPSRTGAHLARLAVCPEWQGRGLGRALVADLIAHYERRGGRELTVNTQHNNAASLAVYHHLNFRPTGTEFPVYQFSL